MKKYSIRKQTPMNDNPRCVRKLKTLLVCLRSPFPNNQFLVLATSTKRARFHYTTLSNFLFPLSPRNIPPLLFFLAFFLFASANILLIHQSQSFTFIFKCRWARFCKVSYSELHVTKRRLIVVQIIPQLRVILMNSYAIVSFAW